MTIGCMQTRSVLCARFGKNHNNAKGKQEHRKKQEKCGHILPPISTVDHKPHIRWRCRHGLPGIHVARYDVREETKTLGVYRSRSKQRRFAIARCVIGFNRDLTPDDDSGNAET